MGAALTPADAQEEEDEEDSQADHDHKQPVCRERTGREREAWEGRGTQGHRDTGTVGRCRIRGRVRRFVKLAREAATPAGFSSQTGATAADGRPPSTTQAGPEFRNLHWAPPARQKTRGDLAGARTGRSRRGATESQLPRAHLLEEHRRRQSTGAPCLHPRPLLSQPAHPKSQSQVTRGHGGGVRWG